MTEPFVRRPAETGLRRLVGNRRTCIREIEDSLAQAASVRDVTPEQIAGIAKQHGVDLTTRLGTARREFYRRLLEYCLADQELSDEESADVAHLRRLLVLSDADAAEVHDQVARAVYGQAIDQVLADHRLDPEEVEFLSRLGGALGLPKAERNHLQHEGAARARHRFVARNLAHDGGIVAGSHRSLDLSGTSPHSLEDAIRAALAEAASAVHDLRGFEVTKIHGALEGGSVARWEVSLRAKFGAPE